MRRISRRRGHPRLRYITGNAADVNLLEAVISGSKADAEDGIDEVYHLAAAVGVALVAADPMRTIETNIRQPSDCWPRSAEGMPRENRSACS